MKPRSDATQAFRDTGEAVASLYERAAAIVAKFGWGGALFGGWVGLVFGVKLVQLSLRRRRDDYEPDRAACVSCGRCYWYCPTEQARLGLIQELPVIAAPAAPSKPEKLAVPR